MPCAVFFRYQIKTEGAKKSETNSLTTSVKAADLRMGVATFCKAFPWHFVMDKKLELVQLGSGFMRLFGSYLAKYGTQAATYFEFHRPRSSVLCFNEIVKRTNSPFVLAIKKIKGDETFTSHVSN